MGFARGQVGRARGTVLLKLGVNIEDEINRWVARGAVLPGGAGRFRIESMARLKA